MSSCRREIFAGRQDDVICRVRQTRQTRQALTWSRISKYCCESGALSAVQLTFFDLQAYPPQCLEYTSLELARSNKSSSRKSCSPVSENGPLKKAISSCDTKMSFVHLIIETNTYVSEEVSSLPPEPRSSCTCFC